MSSADYKMCIQTTHLSSVDYKMCIQTTHLLFVDFKTRIQTTHMSSVDFKTCIQTTYLSSVDEDLTSAYKLWESEAKFCPRNNIIMTYNDLLISTIL